MRKLLLYCLLLFSCQDLCAQYQKTINTNSLGISGLEEYYALTFSRQVGKKDNPSLSALYYKDAGSTVSFEHYIGNVFYSHTFVRIRDLYLNGGGGLFFAYTQAEDIIGNNVTDNSTGVSANLDLEYYLSHWLVLFGDFKQLVFLNSDFYSSQLLYGFGLKVIF